MVSNRELIEAALQCLHRLRRADGAKCGNVAAAVASSSGRIHQGMNLFTRAGAAGICAERIALGAMATAGENEPAKIVSVWRPRSGGEVHIVSPCGGVGSSSINCSLLAPTRSSSWRWIISFP